MKTQFAEIDKQAVNTIRLLAVDMVQNANSGHPGLPLGAAPMAYVLWSRFLRFDPNQPDWLNRDRFVLSAGHGSALLYSLLHLYGYDLPLEELKNFRKLGSRTPGHPESGMTPGVEVTTGPLGQGFGNGVGMAIAERFLGSNYNKEGHTIIDNYIYGIVSDGDLMEGVASEAASLAGHLKLGKLIYLYDDNGISLDGSTNFSFTEDRMARFKAYGWHTLTVNDGNDLEAIYDAVTLARGVTDQPSIIAVKTIIGYGSPQQGTNKVHGNALGEANLKATKIALGWDPELYFHISPEIKELLLQPGLAGRKLTDEWSKIFSEYKNKYPAEAEQLTLSMAGKLPYEWDADLPVFEQLEQVSTRQASGKVLAGLKACIPWLIGGAADLSSSNETPGKADESFQPGSYHYSNIWFGVREHGMGAAMNGIDAYGCTRVYGATFLTFSDYMRGAIRVAALSKQPVTYIFTHDSIALGEDGPTHQPIEQLSSLRLIPGLTVVRPADANETVDAWRFAVSHQSGPVALILSRQKLPVYDRSNSRISGDLMKGAYVLSESPGDIDIILLATGSEVKLAVGAQEALAKDGIGARVISMPSLELFEKQDQDYKDNLLLPHIHQRLAIEAGVTAGWWKYVTTEGDVLGIDYYGESGDGEAVLNYFGFTVENVVSKAKAVINRKK